MPVTRRAAIPGTRDSDWLQRILRAADSDSGVAPVERDDPEPESQAVNDVVAHGRSWEDAEVRHYRRPGLRAAQVHPEKALFGVGLRAESFRNIVIPNPQL